MIRIKIELDTNDCIRKCRAEGHSLLAKPGVDILCAAVTILLRTAYRFLYSLQLVENPGKTPEKGNLFFTISAYPETEQCKIKGITDFLILGLSDLACEYPERLKLQLSRKQ